MLAALVLVLALSSSGVALAQQLVPATRNAISLTASPVAGSTAFGLHLSYPLNDTWDFLLGYDTLSASTGRASLLGIGGRYHFPSTAPNVDPYLAAEYLSASITIPGFGTGTGTGFLAGVGASISLASNWKGFGTVGLVSGAGGTTSAYDAGIEYRASQQFSLVIGASNVFSSGALYFGVSIGLPGR